jgi:hypothetical protein
MRENYLYNAEEIIKKQSIESRINQWLLRKHADFTRRAINNNAKWAAKRSLDLVLGAYFYGPGVQAVAERGEEIFKIKAYKLGLANATIIGIPLLSFEMGSALLAEKATEQTLLNSSGDVFASATFLYVAANLGWNIARVAYQLSTKKTLPGIGLNTMVINYKEISNKIPFMYRINKTVVEEFNAIYDFLDMHKRRLYEHVNYGIELLKEDMHRLRISLQNKSRQAKYSALLSYIMLQNTPVMLESFKERLSNNREKNSS